LPSNSRLPASSHRYASLYDGTVASDYYRAMSQAVQQMFEPPKRHQPAISATIELIALVDILGGGQLDYLQQSTLQTLRDRILEMAIE
jgi:hypothetical protein